VELTGQISFLALLRRAFAQIKSRSLRKRKFQKLGDAGKFLNIEKWSF